MKPLLSLLLVSFLATPVLAKTSATKDQTADKSKSASKAAATKHSGKASKVSASQKAKNKKTGSKKPSNDKPAEKAPPTASEVVQKFYEAYMDFKKTKTNKAPQLTFSKSFRDLIKKSLKLCKQRAKGDVCGFGADGDIYLNTQDTDAQFSFKTSKFRIYEPEPGDVDVYFDPEPSLNKPVGTNDKKIHYKMIEENGKWVVDEIFYDQESARQMIETEMLLLQKN